MSVAGVLLAFEPQITEWLERDRRIVVPPPGAARLPLETLVARAREARPDVRPSIVTLHSDPTAAFMVSFGRDGEPARPGSQLQLAQRDRDLVRAGALRDHAHRPRHVLPVGERPPLPVDRLQAPSAGGGRGAPGAGGRGRRPARGGSRTRRAPGPDGRRPCDRRPGRPLGAGGATGAGLGPHQPARPGTAGRPAHLRHPGADRMASYAPLPAHPRPDHRRGRPLGARSPTRVTDGACGAGCDRFTPARPAGRRARR